MMNHICDKCIYKYEPESISDFYKKTLTTPDLHYWAIKEFKHRYWLCSNPKISKVDNVDESMIYKQCSSYNLNGTCTFFKVANAENILPSTSEIGEPTDPIYVGDEVTVEVTNTANEEAEEEQNISYKYTWYKNGRKLFQKKSNELTIDTSVEATDTYYCIVTQSIENNGDGGVKTVDVKTNEITVTIEAAEEDDDTTEDTTE